MSKNISNKQVSITLHLLVHSTSPTAIDLVLLSLRLTVTTGLSWMYNLVHCIVLLLIYSHSSLATMSSLPDRRDQLPLSPDQTRLKGIDTEVKDAGLDHAVQRILNEQEGSVLTHTHAGISGDEDGRNEQRGIVFANSHNDEMQKEPFVSGQSTSTSSLLLGRHLDTPTCPS